MKTIMRFKRERINAENDKQKYGIQSFHYIKYNKIRVITKEIKIILFFFEKPWLSSKNVWQEQTQLNGFLIKLILFVFAQQINKNTN